MNTAVTTDEPGYVSTQFLNGNQRNAVNSDSFKGGEASNGLTDVQVNDAIQQDAGAREDGNSSTTVISEGDRKMSPTPIVE